MLQKRTSFALLASLVVASSVESAAILSEGFENVGALPGLGWEFQNNSDPLGPTGWFQGNPAVFPAQAGGPSHYIAANFENAVIGGDISNWMITPEISIADGDVVSFFTRSAGASFPDRLEVRLSTNGASADVGSTDTSVGDFTTTLLTVNPFLVVGEYPEDWILFSIVVSGLSNPTTGRYALRYFVENTLLNANYIGIDTLLIERAVPEPSVAPLLLLAGGCFLYLWRRRNP